MNLFLGDSVALASVLIVFLSSILYLFMKFKKPWILVLNILSMIGVGIWIYLNLSLGYGVEHHVFLSISLLFLSGVLIVAASSLSLVALVDKLLGQSRRMTIYGWLQLSGIFFFAFVFVHYSISVSKEKKLVKAIHDGRIANIREELSHSPNQFLKFHETYLLHMATSVTQPDIVRYLIKNGARINQKNKEGKTPLNLLVKNTTYHLTDHYIETLNILIQSNSDLSCRDIFAIFNMEKPERMIPALERRLIDKTVQMNVSQVECFIEYLILNNFKSAVIRSLNRGLKVNHRFYNDRTALMIAAEEGHVELVRLLLQKGAASHIKGGFGESALHLAKNLQVVKMLVESGADIHGKNKFGETPLYSHVKKQSIDIVEYLIKKGAAVNSRKGSENTSLDVAIKNSDYKMVQLLIASGANLNLKNEKKQIALHFASEICHPEITEYLLKSGATIDFFDIDGNTPLHVAALKECAPEIIELFLWHVKDFNQKDRRGETILHHMAKRGMIDIVRLILRKGGKVNEQNIFGDTAVHVATKSKNMELAALLVKSGAKLTIQNLDKKTAADYLEDEELRRQLLSIAQ